MQLVGGFTSSAQARKMKIKFKQYRYIDSKDLEMNPEIAIENFKQEYEINDTDKIRKIRKDDALYLFEDELNIPIKITNQRIEKELLREQFELDYLYGNRAFERYSYFKIQVSNSSIDGKSIIIESEIEYGKEYIKCKKQYKDWLIPELYICSIVAGIKKYCIENNLPNLKFKITDLESNLYTSHHSSFYAIEKFLDKDLKPRIKKEA